MKIETLTPADQMHGYQLGVDGYMSIREACEQLGDISHDTLDRLIKTNRIRKGRFPGRRRAAICRRSVEVYKSTAVEL